MQLGRWLTVALLAASPELAQQTDPRLAGPMIQALQAQLALSQALLKVQMEDAEAQKTTLWEWFLAAREPQLRKLVNEWWQTRKREERFDAFR